MMNEQTLTVLFDLQRFANNSRLAGLIAETEGRCGGAPLSEDDLDEVWAAGASPLPPTKKPLDRD